MSKQLHIFLFDQPRVEYDGEPTYLRPRALALLAHLATMNRPQSRERLITLLNPLELNPERARHNLNLAISDIRRKALAKVGAEAILETERYGIRLSQSDRVVIDLDTFSDAIYRQQHMDTLDTQTSIETLQRAVEFYGNGFLSGFSLPECPDFSDWQQRKSEELLGDFKHILDQLIVSYLDQAHFDAAVACAHRWVEADELDETGHLWLIKALYLGGNRHEALQACRKSREISEREYGDDLFEQIQVIHQDIKDNRPLPEQLLSIQPPRLFVGRQGDLLEIKSRLGIPPRNVQHNVIVIRGWPGVGKTTLVKHLAHERDVRIAFSRHIVNINPNISAGVKGNLDLIGRRLGIPDVGEVLDEAVRSIRERLQAQRYLFVVDDVYESDVAEPFKALLGPKCTLVITTRFPQIAQRLAPNRDDIFALDTLPPDVSLELLGRLAADVVKTYPQESRQLVQDLEGLPLAIHVAGRLLASEMDRGLDVRLLMEEIRSSHLILDQAAPEDRFDLKTGTTPTIQLLLRKTTDRLNDDDRDRFARLSVFAEKPAAFDYDAIQAVWEADKAETTRSIRTLTNYGLLEYDRLSQNYQMHSLLVMHAESLLTGDDEK